MPGDWQYSFRDSSNLAATTHVFVPPHSVEPHLTAVRIGIFPNISQSQHTPDHVASYFSEIVPLGKPVSEHQLRSTGELRIYSRAFVTSETLAFGAYLGSKVLYLAGVVHEARDAVYTAVFETPIEGREQYVGIGLQIVDSIMLSEAPLDETLEA